ncbi:hypothetical protein M422DRAFT_250200 [Sphaerobolus stellatus SS14]|uniref:Uncharacterized protein n=1 Tax=Sphaerobolus stellatus (strain SS14) TaxID=990650 RepID=A0A0C9VGJ8_SPHS4|nr:hypothetical protein M422DRAFT_250200 [Sphaerobolus stellatus SS14]
MPRANKVHESGQLTQNPEVIPLFSYTGYKCNPDDEMEGFLQRPLLVKMSHSNDFLFIAILTKIIRRPFLPFIKAQHHGAVESRKASVAASIRKSVQLSGSVPGGPGQLDRGHTAPELGWSRTGWDHWDRSDPSGPALSRMSIQYQYLYINRK